MAAACPCCESTVTWWCAESFLKTSWMNSGQVEQDDDDDPGDGIRVIPSSGFCPGQASLPLVPLAGAFLRSNRPQSDVVKQGYLGKQERSHRRYFVLRAGSHIGPGRLEWYKSRENFIVLRKSSGKVLPFESCKKGVIYLRCCLGVCQNSSPKKGLTVSLYAKDQTMVLAVEDLQQQDQWYFAIKTLMAEEVRDEDGEEFDEEDDGYGSLPPAAYFKEVWPVVVKLRGLGRSKSLSGEKRLCLTASSLILVKMGTGTDLPSLTIALLSVRRFGHQDGLFYLELGRTAPLGPGEIWMGSGDQENPGMAQHIHKVVRDTVHAARALPNFSHSPTSSSAQPPMFSPTQHVRFKYKPVYMRPLSPRNADAQSPTKSCSPSPESPSSVSEDVDDRGYMMMSPVGGSPEANQDDYMTMTSPEKQTSSGLHMKLHSPASYAGPQPLQTSGGLLRESIGIFEPHRRQMLAQTRSTSCSSPPHDAVLSKVPVRTPLRGGRHSATRRRLSSCLMSCLQAGDTS